MIRSITARNVNHAFPDGIMWLKAAGIHEPTRGGMCIVAPGPVITTYLRPEERLLFNPVRDANHVFHLMEAIWMFAGSRDIRFLLDFNSKFGAYAEGNIQHGAYGHRWRRHFPNLEDVNLGPVDQIMRTRDLLAANPNDRRVVMAMWDPAVDLGADKRDVPCNTTIMFDCRGGALNMTVCCRSNDMLWGAYGANVVHMSMLQELIANSLDIPVGHYRQFSNNFHAYADNEQVKHFMDNPPMEKFDYYSEGLKTHRLLQRDESLELFLTECENFVTNPHFLPSCKFLAEVAYPLREAYLRRKAGLEWQSTLNSVADGLDWKLAFMQWAQRREQHKEQK